MEPQAFDPDALAKLLELIGNDQESLHELINSFLEEAPRLIADLGAAVSCGDADKVRLAAHTLRSSAVDFGVPRLAQICGRLEADAKQGKIDNDPAILDFVKQSYQHGETALRKILENAT